MRHTLGSTLIELVLTLVIFGLVAALAVPSLMTITDRLQVRAAAQDVVFALAATRAAATRRGDYATFSVDPRTGRLRVTVGTDTLVARELGARRGVTVSATRDTIVYAPTGMGWGAANTTIILARGRRADTITTSRLGRVKWK